jgi:multimeric flavodoxin WrbA
MAYGRDIGDVEQDQEGIANMRNIGQNMAWLLKKIHSSS